VKYPFALKEAAERDFTMETQHVEVIIVGGGQAGLAMSYYLTLQGRQHLVLEQGQVGESWRSKRWDSLHLVGPNWELQLPGFFYQGDDPDGFLHHDGYVAYLEAYAQSFHAPLKTGVQVIAVEQKLEGSGYIVRTTVGNFEATQVVIATGAYQKPKIPAWSANLPEGMCQLAANQYRRPDALPAGPVLVVGSGESGCQIAEEIRHSGRMVYLAVGSAPWLPRRYRGKDGVWWFNELGGFDQTVDTPPEALAKYGSAAPQLTGKDGGRDCNIHTLARDGVILLGHLRGVQAGKLMFASDLQDSIAKADQVATDFYNAIDELIRTRGIDAPEETRRTYHEAYGQPGAKPVVELDLQETGLSTIIWATGYRPDLEWVRVPVLDDEGYPKHQRGVTACPGLYFLGLEFLYKVRSGNIDGVGPDAEYLAPVIAIQASSKS